MIEVWPTGQILHHAHTHHTQTHAHIHTTSFHSPTYFSFKDSAGCLPFIFTTFGFQLLIGKANVFFICFFSLRFYTGKNRMEKSEGRFSTIPFLF